VNTLVQPAAPATDRRPPRILVVDDERSMREMLQIVLRREGYEVLLAENGRAAIDLLEREPVDLLISDIKMPDLSGVDVLRAAKRIDQDILGIMITAFASTETAVEAMRLGACDYLSKPFDIDLLKMKVREKIENRQLRQENLLLKRTLGLTHQFANIIGRSEAMLDVFKMIETVARTNSTILLTGESGTGKGLVAQAIHFHSLRRDKPMVSLNCGALPENLLESELFGHMRGAFTGADRDRKGVFELADGGTLFLDEIGDMSLPLQAKVLRALQEGEIRPVGGKNAIKVDVRIVSATHRDLDAMMKAGTFREDLFYRLNVVRINIPSLRERKEDIPLLVEHFLTRAAEASGVPRKRMDISALQLLLRYDWPGNVRELENEIMKLSVLTAAPVITQQDLVQHRDLLEKLTRLEEAEAGFQSLDTLEKKQIEKALAESGGNRARAATLLGISRATIYRKLREYGISD